VIREGPSSQWRRKGGRGKLPPYGWTSKNYVICVIVMELLRITRQIHRTAVEERATLIHRQHNRSVVTADTPGAVCDMPSCRAVLATLTLSRKPKHQPPQQLPVSACLLFQFLIKMRSILYWYAVRCPPPTVENGETHTSLPPLLQNPGGAITASSTRPTYLRSFRLSTSSRRRHCRT